MRNESKYLHDLEAFAVRFDRERATARPVAPSAPITTLARAPRPDLADHPTVRAMRARANRRASLRNARERGHAARIRALFAECLTDEERAWFHGAR